MAGANDEAGAVDSLVSFLENSQQQYRELKAHILEQRALLHKAGVDVLRPCSGGDDGPCWLRNHLSALNGVFTKAALEVTVHNTGGLAISPAFGSCPKEEDCAIADFLMDWLLAQHLCIHELRLKASGASFWVLPGVRRLDISGVPAKSVVKAVKGAKMLESITVADTQDIKDEVDDLASAMRENTSLKSLEFRNNNFPAGTFRKIFDGVSGCDKLQSLSLENESLSEDDERALRNLLERGSSLKIFTLGAINEESIIELTSRVLEGWSREESDIFDIVYAGNARKRLHFSFTGILSNLRALRLSCSNIEDVAFNVARLLTRNTSIKELDLSMNDIGEAGALALAAALKENTTLEQLHLYENALNSVAFLAFAQALNSNKALRELLISKIDLSDEMSNQLFDLDRFPGLFKRVLICWQQTRLKELASIVRVNAHHESLTVKIDDKVSLSDLDALFDALSVNTTVTELNFISWCNLFPAFTRRFARFLKTNTSVGCVEVRLRTDSEDLILEILKALKENTAIWSFHISAAEVTPAVARVVKDLIKTNTSLNTLSLYIHGDCKLDSEALRLIAEGLQENMTLVDLCIAWEPQVLDGLPEIWQFLARNKSLVSLAALCVTGLESSPQSVEVLKIVSKSRALVEKVAEMSGETAEVAKEAIAEAAGRFLDS